MSYVLINGKRYYKDDRTGRTTLDNVSQAEADRRARRNKGTARTNGTYRLVHTGFPWKTAIVCAVIFLFIGAFFHNRSHVSSEELSIIHYMQAQEKQVPPDAVETESATAEEVQEAAYVLSK